MRAELVYCDGLLFRDNRVVVPKVMRTDMLAKIHESHQGIVKSKQRARSILFWPGMNADVENVVSSCVTCQQFRKNQAPEGTPFMINLPEILSMAAVHAVYGKNRQALLWTGHETHCTHVTHPIHTLPAPTHSRWISPTYCRATLCCQACVWPTTRKSRGARRARPPWPIVAECHWPVEENLCGCRHMCGPAGRMSCAARTSHTARIARRPHTAHITRNARRSHTARIARKSRGSHTHALHAGHTLHVLHAGHAPIVSHCTQVGHYTVSVLSKRDALKSRMSRTHNAWQAMHPGNACMSCTARIAHTTRMSHS